MSTTASRQPSTAPESESTQSWACRVTGAGVMLMSGEIPGGSLCTTDEVSQLIEELQYTLGEGPCVDACRQDPVVAEPDLADPVTRRWPAFTRAGGVDLPGEIAGKVAVHEVVVHGWDMAAATGHDYACEPELLQAAYAFVQAAFAQDPDGSRGLFGPPVSVPDSAPLPGRLIGLAGRDPAWRPDGTD